MIPKIIHYCWYGDSSPSPLMVKCLDSWKTVLKDYKVVRWDESNTDLRGGYLSKALENRKWANISNLVRLEKIYEIGGIYLDTDVEAIRPFDNLLDRELFFGFENKKFVSNAVFGSTAGQPFLKELIEQLKVQFDGTELANLSSPHLVTEVLRRKGLKRYKRREINIGNVSVFPISCFYPLPYGKTMKARYIKKNTYCIHHWALRW